MERDADHAALLLPCLFLFKLRRLKFFRVTEMDEMTGQFLEMSLALCIQGFCICKFNPPEIQNIFQNSFRKFQKHNLNLPCTTIYIAFTLHLQLFTWHLDCIRYYKEARNDLQSMGRWLVVKWLRLPCPMRGPRFHPWVWGLESRDRTRGSEAISTDPTRCKRRSARRS